MKPNHQLQSALMESTSEVLETMFFIGVLGERAGAVAEDLVAAELVFSGKPSGTFGVGVPASTGKTIAANFLGKEEAEVTPAEIEQVVCELTNMICGSVLSRIEAESRFELLHPAITLAASAMTRPEALSSCFDLEQGTITVWAATDKVAPTAAPVGCGR